MKTAFALLLGMLVLESCTTLNTKTLTTNPIPAVCAVTNGIFVIVIDENGIPVEQTCPDIRGKPISRQLKPKPGLTPVGTPFVLGDILKLKTNTDPDPCIQWSMGGSYPTYYCW